MAQDIIATKTKKQDEQEQRELPIIPRTKDKPLVFVKSKAVNNIPLRDKKHYQYGKQKNENYYNILKNGISGFQVPVSREIHDITPVSNNIYQTQPVQRVTDKVNSGKLYKTEIYQKALPANQQYYERLKNLRKTREEKGADVPNDVKLYNALEFVSILKNNNLDNIGYFNQSSGESRLQGYLKQMNYNLGDNKYIFSK
ncbi:hypothetical protein [Candidatus Deianiraea vastatrix]|uniref:Uncharacterized protein n=1 Tax=Candidatus Deianiraea vastatrix TaxID=2163644 RepID=A0A5B8XFU7_9RICK|nr:hypothetical protein [Candidatus Deianiraea vastatrix]QED23224.1 hypothetical protein Deia_00423 [Candidatus Deianiraea vastatrix]